LLCRLSYEGVRCRPPTDRTPLPGFGDQVGPRPWPMRSCSYVRRVCPASRFLLRAVTRFLTASLSIGQKRRRAGNPLVHRPFRAIHSVDQTRGRGSNRAGCDPQRSTDRSGRRRRLGAVLSDTFEVLCSSSSFENWPLSISLKVHSNEVNK